ncbi:Translation initiation factor eIF-2B subunit epsi lon [Trichuris trichiura]|uniref:Translation initiation factor eIF2B subunit epsilon n=1 Tax=Trichuris trichiura TaxID=36087 RepID=A0A077YVX2_TRITR|nr:Translation initiation factor eIF-2B subunit epsi lon [Trichuris trichiura]
MSEKKEQKLVAVLLADSFNYRLATLKKPTSLLPVANIHLIDLALEFLKGIDLAHVFIVLTFQSALVKEQVKRCLMGHDLLNKISYVMCESCLSIGDVFRDLDQRAIIKTDFLFFSCGVVSNSSMQKVFEEHLTRRKKNKSCLMTMVYVPAPKNHPCRSRLHDQLLKLDPKSNQLLRFQQLGFEESCAGVSQASLSFNTYLSHCPIAFQSADCECDLMDCSLYVCSPQVPTLFSDNFDFLTMEDLIREVLINEEILGNTIHVYKMEDAYVGTVRDFHTWLSVNKNIIERWCFPFTPDCWPFPSRHSIISKPCYPWKQHNVYLNDTDISIAKSAVLAKNVVVGARCTIGSNTKVVDSTIGDDCSIGDNCSLSNCILMEKVCVGNNCALSESVLSNEVVVGNSCTIGPRCVLGCGVKIPDGQKHVDCREFDSNNFMCGAEPSVDENVDEKLADYFWPEWFPLKIAEPLVNNVDANDTGFRSDVDETNSVDKDYNLFFSEVKESVSQGIAESVPSENIILEINSSKHAYNVTIEQVYKALIQCALQLPAYQNVAPADYLKQLLSVFKQLLPVLKNYFKSERSQLICLDALADMAASIKIVLATIARIVHSLFELDVLEEDYILKWYNGLKENEYASVKQNMAPFVTWLQEAEEESSED